MPSVTSKRIKNISISRPILYGNTAIPFTSLDTKKPPNVPENHTHQWTVFVSDPTKNLNPLSNLIKKVQFKLHETIPNSLRTIESPPFQITETGWGEFEIIIKIFFIQDSNEKYLTLYHHLILHPYDNSNLNSLINNKSFINKSNPSEIVSVNYDEIIFNEPNESFFKILVNQPGSILHKNKSDYKYLYSEELENEEIFRLQNATKTVQDQILKIKEKIKSLESEKSNLLSN
ncbi:YEATS domain-containing protein YAF9 [Ascoidea rubescens DSM 1968]|uniref:Protein AF-9 homolog n=1 Tax=Ascoidea rubescens DSM 1968 TaxID=1344418 RepID=A0A1D2V9R0_9ASCO|nr:yeats-domain-containing protein [Ascoidea rubescens DSM 1968]ODV58396.1 yeats-domain-containing protein [Ascoidea rubescens DSM 1968]